MSERADTEGRDLLKNGQFFKAVFSIRRDFDIWFYDIKGVRVEYRGIMEEKRRGFSHSRYTMDRGEKTMNCIYYIPEIFNFFFVLDWADLVCRQ